MGPQGTPFQGLQEPGIYLSQGFKISGYLGYTGFQEFTGAKVIPVFKISGFYWLYWIS